MRVESSFCDWKPVISGSPQGLVLDICRNLIVIVGAIISQFANHANIYGLVESKDNFRLSKDIDRIINWTEQWQVEFNLDNLIWEVK